jgi:hypothetical protein
VLIKVDIDVSGALALTAKVLKKLPYAINDAITEIAKEVVTEERDMLSLGGVTVRKQFILNRIKILQYSRVGNLTAIVGVDRRVAGSPLLLGLLLTPGGGDKRPSAGSEIAEPITGSPSRPEFAANIPRRMLYKQLGIAASTTSTGKLQFKGKQRTFVIPNVGVFQRTGSGKNDIALLYKFAPGAHIRSRIDFVRVAEDLIARRWNAAFSKAFVLELGNVGGKR